MNRRQFIKSTGAVAAVAATRGCAPQQTSGPGLPGRVFIGAADDYRANLTSVIDAGLREFPSFNVAGKSVLLKPNLVETSESDRPINTHPAVVIAAAESLRRAGASRILVADGPGHRRDIELVLAQSGLGRELRDAKLDFVDLNHDAVVPIANVGNRTKLKTLYLPRAVMQADVVVSIAKLKTHHWAGCTLSMKNCFGLMPGLVYGWPKNILHWEGIENSIVDIVATAKPQFGIVDAIVGMEGDGPLMGTAKQVGTLVLGDRLASLDATCASIMGMNPGRIWYINELARRGFGGAAVADIEQRGETISRFKTRFAVLPQFNNLFA